LGSVPSNLGAQSIGWPETPRGQRDSPQKDADAGCCCGDAFDLGLSWLVMKSQNVSMRC